MVNIFAWVRRNQSNAYMWVRMAGAFVKTVWLSQGSSLVRLSCAFLYANTHTLKGTTFYGLFRYFHRPFAPIYSVFLCLPCLFWGDVSENVIPFSSLFGVCFCFYPLIVHTSYRIIFMKTVFGSVLTLSKLMLWACS